MMTKRLIAFVIAVIFAALANTPSDARQHPKRHFHHKSQIIALIMPQECLFDNSGHQTCGGPIQRPSDAPMGRRHIVPTNGYDVAGDPRPSAWCAWWLRRYLHIPKSAFPPYEYNLARSFAKIGSPAPQGCTNCIAVFSRGRGGHVGLVESWDANGNPVILSGNFNGTVATASHSAHRLIALRWWS